ncbi:MAG: hypothetical protein ACKPJD_25675, partial [Planctomycetaceae bacterium]
TDGTAVTYNLTYSGAFAAKNLDNAQVAVLTDPPVAGGTFTLSWNGQTTAAISLNNNTSAQAADIQSALTALNNIGSSNVSVAWDNTSAAVAPRFLVTFRGALASTQVAPITASGSALQHADVQPRLVTPGRAPQGESQIVTLTKPTTDGSFTLSLTHNSTTYTTSPLAFDATTAEVQAAIT